MLDPESQPKFRSPPSRTELQQGLTAASARFVALHFWCHEGADDLQSARQLEAETFEQRRVWSLGLHPPIEPTRSVVGWRRG